MERHVEDTLVKYHCGHRIDSIFDLAEFGLTDRMNEWIRHQATDAEVSLVDILNMKGAWKRRPAHWASECNQADSLASLLTFCADPTVRDESGFTPLHLAVRSHSYNCVAVLLKNNIKLRDIKDDCGLTPIDICTDSDIKELLATGKAVAPKVKKTADILSCIDYTVLDLETLRSVSLKLEHVQNSIKQEITRQEALVRNIPEDVRCIVCMESPRNILIQPCNHLCVCSGCSVVLKNCPLCRGPLTAQIPVFLG